MLVLVSKDEKVEKKRLSDSNIGISDIRKSIEGL